MALYIQNEKKTLFLTLHISERRRGKETMVKKKSKVLMIFFTLVLLVSMTSSVISREDGLAPPKPSPSSTHEKERSTKSDGVECKSSDSEEECLVKKTVAAHTDYIYTQDLNLSP
ncbi:unnamed protein product [Thlaspi arvense]|uniref:Phytosulfokine n=1 Tax=Thlaspi arvense TaxID=13288 RepID=A0AAU9RBR7_THLAR|nr:unnamed protein product [Thlaspi arvense]